MKKNSPEFSVPRRESPVAIVFILGKTIYNIVTRIWPALLVVFVKENNEKKPDYLLWSVVAIALIAMVISVINYFKTYYFIRGNELHLHKGVIQKIKTNIPFQRIQTVQFEQSILHSIFGVVKMKLDTAGSEKAEIDFYAIEKSEAEVLKNTILQYRKENAPVNAENKKTTAGVQENVILHLGLSALMKVGLTRNHLKSGGLILVFFAWLYENVKELGVDADEYYEEVVATGRDFTFYLSLALLFLMVSVLISLVRSGLLFFDLKLIRASQGFRLISGFFTRKETSAFDHKIQQIGWSDNLLKRKLGFFDVRLHQASSHAMENREKILIPGMNQQKIDQLSSVIFGVLPGDKSKSKPVHKTYFQRFITLLFIPFSAVLGVMLWIQRYEFALVLTLFFILSVWMRYLRFRKTRYQVHDGCVTIWGGAFGEKNVVFPLFKLQGIQWNQNPFQRKRGLVTLEFFLASGTVTLPYITYAEGKQIIDLSLYVTESSTGKWM